MPRTRTTFRPGHMQLPWTREKISKTMKFMAARGPAAGRPNVLEDSSGNPNEMGLEVLKMRQGGMTIREIAAVLELEKSTVGRLVKKWG